MVFFFNKPLEWKVSIQNGVSGLETLLRKEVWALELIVI
jgi:hypothetical protein